jgi:hypothetical protein
MDKIFEIASKVSNPLALAGFFSAVFFLLLKIILEKSIFTLQTKESSKQLIMFIINRIFILAIFSMILGFSGYVLNIIQAKRSIPVYNTLNVSGIVLLNNKELENVNVKILEIEKTAVTNYFGKFNVDVFLIDSIKQLTLTFSHPEAIDHREVFKDLKKLKGITISLQPKESEKNDPPGKSTYLVLSGRVVDSVGDPINNVSVSSTDGVFKSFSKSDGSFKLESPKLLTEIEMLFFFSKEGYFSKEEYYYVNTKSLRIVLHKKN